MRSYDFAPLYRSTVGFDRIANLMDRVLSADVAQPTYPPYNIEKTDENAYRISIAVAADQPGRPACRQVGRVERGAKALGQPLHQMRLVIGSNLDRVPRLDGIGRKAGHRGLGKGRAGRRLREMRAAPSCGEADGQQRRAGGDAPQGQHGPGRGMARRGDHRPQMVGNGFLGDRGVQRAQLHPAGPSRPAARPARHRFRPRPADRA